MALNDLVYNFKEDVDLDFDKPKKTFQQAIIKSQINVKPTLMYPKMLVLKDLGILKQDYDTPPFNDKLLYYGFEVVAENTTFQFRRDGLHWYGTNNYTNEEFHFIKHFSKLEDALAPKNINLESDSEEE